MARRRVTQADKDRVTARRRQGVVIDLQILGTNVVRRRLKKLKLSAGRNVVNKAIKMACKNVLKPTIDANINAISPGTYGRGRLKNNPTKVLKISRKRKHMGYGIFTASREKLNIKPNEAYYPAIIEVGGKTSGYRPVIYIEGRHMLKNARNRKSAAVNNFLRKHMHMFIDEEIEKIKKRDAKRVAKGKGRSAHSGQLAN